MHLKSRLAEIISLAFILLFIYTSFHKFIALDTLQHILKQYPIIGSQPALAAWALPLTELAIAILLYRPKTNTLGLFLTSGLMLAFSIYVLYMLLYTSNLPCTCGGLLTQLTWPGHLILNIILLVLSILAQILKKTAKNPVILPQTAYL